MAVKNATNARNEWITVLKRTSETRQSTTTLTADTDLLVPIVSGKTYAIRCHIGVYIDSATSNYKYDFTHPGSVFTKHYFGRETAGSNAATTVEVAGAGSLPSRTVTGSFANHIQYEFLIRSPNSGGNFTFRWAQNSSEAADLTILNGSYIEYIEF